MSKVAAAVSGASYMVLLTVLQRLVTFGVNQVALRYVVPEQYGFVASLELQLATVLFLGREGVRLALLREDLVRLPAGRRARRLNVAWLAVPVATAAAWAIAAWRIAGGMPAEAGSAAACEAAVALYGLATFVEMLSEPLFVTAQSALNFRVRASAEAAGVVARALVALAAVSHGLGVAAFGCAQLAYAAVVSACYYGWMWRSQLRLWPSPAAAVDREALALAAYMSAQSVVKHVLTEGDRIVLQLVASLYDQGVYALVTNYGSLAARLLFAPVEEASRALFAQASREEGRELLRTALKLVTLIGLVFAFFGSVYAPLVVRYLAGPTWTDTEAARVLSVYCVYVLFMAVNGLSEAFVFAVASQQEVAALSRWNLAFFASYAALALALIPRLGTTGLVLANCAGLSLRVAYSSRFINAYFGTPGAFPAAAFPPAPVLLACALASAGLSAMPFSDTSHLANLAHVGAGAASGLVVLALLWRQDRPFFAAVAGLRSSRTSPD